jgi:DNA repair exonuclease SbcCD ATPase subunit
MKKVQIFLLATILLAVSCGPSVDGEKEDWNENLKAMDALKVQYPALNTKIDKAVEEAKLIWVEAEKISEEEKQAEKMADANKVLDDGCIGNLKDMEEKISSVKAKISTVKKLRKKKKAASRNAKNFANDAIEEANDALSYAERNMSFSEDEMDNDPCFKITKAFKKLSDAKNSLGKAVTKLNKKKKNK